MNRLWLKVLLPLCLPALILAAPQVKERDLPQHYREWLNVVSYIILPAEREVFLKLLTDRERDIFIESFWKQRDPTPGTPQNEYKEEYSKRLDYANKFYGRDTARAGWMTDRGRIYIVLGPPASVERFDSVAGLYPCQVWYYYGDKAKGLPTYFGLLFYQRGGAGEYTLYNPVSDGPASLIIDTRTLDQTNYEQLYEKIRELAPTLAGPAFSIIPDERPAYYTPAPRNAILLAQIMESPKKDVNPAYATHFLSYKGIVSTEYLTNYIESSAAAVVIGDPALGIDFLHLSISPQTMSLDYFKPRDQYYCNFKLSVSLRQGEKVVFQYSKDYPLYLPPDKVGSVQGSGISVLDLFPIAAGTYDLTVLLQNAVGKEFCLFEKAVTVPTEGGPARLAGPVIGYKLQDAPAGANAPFKMAEKQLLTDPKATLGSGDEVAYGLCVLNVSDDLWARGEVEVVIEGSAAKGKPARTFARKLAEQPYRRSTSIVEAFPARDFPPDYYEMKFSLKDGRGQVLSAVSAPFIVSPAGTVPHPVTLTRALSAADSFLYFYGLAIQHDKAGDRVKAEAAYRKALGMRPDYAEGLADFTDFLIRSGKSDEALRLVEPLKSREKYRFTYFLLRGRALMEKGEFAPAVQSLLEGNKIYNSDTRLLNALGFCYFKTSRKREALDALAASLRLNTDQAEVKVLVATIKKELK